MRRRLLGVLGVLALWGCAQNNPPQPTMAPNVEKPTATVEKSTAPAAAPEPVAVAKPAPAAPPPANVALRVPAANKSRCQGRGWLGCKASGCGWNAGYTTAAGKRVAGYCHVSTAKAAAPPAPPATATKAKSTSTSKCHSVSGYTRSNGTRVAGYRRCRQ